MSHPHTNPLEHPEVQLASGPGYLLVFLFEYLAMAVCVGLIDKHVLSDSVLLVLLPAIALCVLIAQMYAFFKLNLSEGQIWYTVSLVLTLPLLVITIGLTVIMFFTLAHRTMLGGM
ncbi:hypothetical protein [Acidihalobacter ferrooxydans]|uniref:Cytochrome O ubiquinol oxidase n=1 Tax=Acidihalobacter ferrooxydans TaxID=1765967 RepID=A0A1P8UER2_9GAMM|nr:hypothetical protein [Acidihalobacter ferrooxydans]APZ42343.1 hypothetical protein BW247_03935 [Acidihalobacter ferrooxydans]